MQSTAIHIGLNIVSLKEKDMIGKKTLWENSETVNGLKYIKDVDYYVLPSGVKIRKALFECICGNQFEVVVNNVVSGRTNSCGCLKKKSIEYALAGLDESGNTLGVQRIFSTSDGEGFDFFILIAPDDEIGDYPLPYTADWIADVQDYSKLTERLKAFYEAMKEKNE